jgi:hypothetical protein
MYRLTAVTAYGSFVRRTALAAVVYKGEIGNPGDPSTERHSGVSFGIDGNVEQFISLSANFEKNQTRTFTTVRYFSDNNCVGVPLASIARQSFAALHLSDGPMIRATPSSRDPAGSIYWHQFLQFFCAILGLDRSFIGMQSFRRGYAIALKQIGRLSDEDIQAIGYWWSGASRVYSGTARSIRLNLQRHPQNREVYGSS